MYREENRALNYAIAASLVLHGVLLFGFAQRDRSRPAESPMPSILARLVESPSAAPIAELPSPPAPAKSPPRAKSAAPKRLARPAPSPTPQPAAEPAIEQAPVAETQVESTSPQPPAPDSVAAAPLAGAPPAEPAVDPGSLERYRLELKLVAARYKRYPRMATDNNWKGVVALRVVVGPSGQLASLTVTKTSGHEVLDRQAQEMFRSAAADVPVPPVLRGKQFAVDVAVDYYFTD
jgi:periplasmic protein TonB